jgi:hypothetical protein
MNIDGSPWQTYYMPTPYQGAPTWAINTSYTSEVKPILPSAEHAWTNYMGNVAASFSRAYPDMDVRVYQITWEADEMSPSLWDAGNEELVRIYKLCYEAIHGNDSKAMVVGPTCFPGAVELNNSINIESYGLSNYIDGWSLHAYTTEDLEEGGFIQNLRAQLAVFSAPKGLKLIPFVETEHGYPTGLDRALELRQARWLLKVSLVILGEGGMTTWNFYLHDYDINGYGIFYGLGLTSSGTFINNFGNPKLSPKPFVSVLAAATFLLDGCDGRGFFNDSQTQFTASQIGYLFTCEKDSSQVRAVWDYHTPSLVQIYASFSKATLYDWNGNGQTVYSQTDGSGATYFSVLARNEPVYLKTYPKL